jgi:hypothetical protein
MKCTLAEWQQRMKPIDSLIVQASSMDCDDGWRPWPIGMSWQYIQNYKSGTSLQLGPHEQIIQCGITLTTDMTRRPSGINRRTIVSTLASNGIHNSLTNHNVYYTMLPHYKFVISPEGNGIDCHRHYEALLAGCIPICEKNPFTEEKYKGCPILWTTDYSEITPDYLEANYAEMINTEYDFSCLFLSYYDDATKALIKASGNFWLKRLYGDSFLWYQ